MNRGLLTRLFQGLGLRVAEHEEMSDVDLRGALANALRADEPGFEDIWEVKPLEGTVVYITFPADEPLFFRRSFEVSEEGEVSLADDREQVEPVMRFEPVAASAEGEGDQEPEDQNDTEPVAAKDCGCESKQAKQGQLFRAARDDDDTAAKAEGEPMTKKELVGRLIAAERSPFDEKDRETLESAPEERLKGWLESMEAEPKEPEEPEGQKATEPEPKPETQAEPDPEPDTVQLSKAEHARILAAAQAHEAEQERRKAELLATLKGKQDVWTEAELQAMSVEQLDKLGRALRANEPAHDYSGKGLPVAAAANAKKATLPDAYGLGERFVS